MKKIYILFVLIVFLLAVKISDAEPNKPGFPKKLSDITDLSDIGCDLCGCYMGLDPNFSMNQVGIRFHTYKFFSEGHPSTGSSATSNDPQLDHADHGENSSTEYYNDLELYLRYYISPKLRLLFSIPFSSNDINGKTLNGTGDAKLLTQYQIYNTDITGKTNFWHRIFLGGGVKFPTGVYNKTLTYGVVDPHFQPGTGSFDFLFNGLYMAKLEKDGLGWRNDIVYTVNTENSNGYRFANRFNITSTFTYDIITSTLTFLPHAGIYFESSAEDKQDGKDTPDTGGNAFFGTGGVDVYYDVFSLDFNYQFKISDNLNGDQPGNEFRLYLGLGYAF